MNLVTGRATPLPRGVLGAAKNTVVKLLGDLGDACSAYMNETLRDLPLRVSSNDQNLWMVLGGVT